MSSAQAAIKWDVLAVGLACYDHIVKVPAFEDAAAGCYAGPVSVQGGGMSATAAAAVVKLGGRARLYTRIADDSFGRFIVDELRELGVEVVAAVSERGASAVSTVFVDTGGERRFVFYPGKDLDFPGYEIPPEDIASAHTVLTDGRWESASLAAARKAVELGVPLVLDIGHQRDHETELLRIADFPVLSTVMLGELGVYPAEREKLARRVLAGGRAQLCFITCGDEGVELYRKTDGGVEMQAFEAFEVEVVDTTGAGDAFHGAFCLGMARGWEMEKIVQVAQAAGALTCRAIGGREPLPTMEEVEEFLDERS